MDCGTARRMMHPYLDGELDLTASLELENHVAGCSSCRRGLANYQSLSAAVAAGPLYYTAPDSLRRSVTTALRREERATGRGRSWLPWAGGTWRPALAGALALVLIAVLAWGITRSQAVSAHQDLLAQQVLSSSLRALMAGPLTDVQSSDQHTVKPWFAGKLDFSPNVPDFAAQGFPLIGGRLDYLDGQPVATLVYRHQQHVINVYTWPAPGQGDTAPRQQTQNGYHLANWTQGGMNYYAATDMDPTELAQFVQLIRGN